MKSKLNLPDRQKLPIRTLSQIGYHEQCVAHLAIGQIGVKLEAERIWQATNGSIDILIADIHETGLAEVTAMLKQRKPKFQTIAVELVSHLSLADTHPDFQSPARLETGIISEGVTGWSSEVILIRNDEAVVLGGRLAKAEGLQDDIVTCALLCAAVRVGQHLDNAGKLIVIFSSNSSQFTLPLKHPWR
jgi:cysteine synthase